MPPTRQPLRGKLLTAEDFHPAPEASPDLVARFLGRSPDFSEVIGPARTLVWHSERVKMTGKLPPVEGNVDHTISVEVMVSAGRWCAPCLWCPASEYPSEVTHLFMCSQCHNNGSMTWVLTKWPARRWEIEEVLTMRPIPHTRNWKPGESPEELALENELNGIPTLAHMNYRSQ